jgi:hypothetical protein
VVENLDEELQDDEEEEETDEEDAATSPAWEALTWSVLRNEFGWHHKCAPAVSCDTWHYFRPGVEKGASSLRSESAHAQKDTFWYSQNTLVLLQFTPSSLVALPSVFASFTPHSSPLHL